MSVLAMGLVRATTQEAIISSGSQWESEKEIVRAAKRGDATAFRALCERHSPRILHTMYRITKNREDAEDAFQDSLLKAYTHIKDFDGRSSFSTWLTRIAINSALMILRKKRNSLEVSMDDSNDNSAFQTYWQVPDHAPDPEKQCAQQERQIYLRGAIEKLRPKIRQVVELHQLQEHSMKESAKILGISVVAAKARLFHAKLSLRKALRPKRISGVRLAKQNARSFHQMAQRPGVRAAQAG